MPRYCAAMFCKNRGGLSSKDNRKISFYPFPLQDKERLQKWTVNMKRGAWLPSKHQYLCSDHFTPDSFDVRWGIRYLKHSAVPTVFAFSNDRHGSQAIQEEWSRPHTRKKKAVPKEKAADNNDINTFVKPSPSTQKKSLLLKKQDKTEKAASPQIECVEKENSETAPPVESEGQNCQKENIKLNDQEGAHSFEILNTNASAVDTTNSAQDAKEELKEKFISVKSEPPSENESTEKQIDSTSPSTWESVGNRAPCHSVEPTNQTLNTDIITGPVGHNEEICYLVEPPETQQCTDTDQIFFSEHSYCRQDTDKEHLWKKIASLHEKITELEKNEEKTVAKLNSLTNLITHLKQENIVSEEKLKVLENYFTTLEFSMVQ
ncbi:THAP domain-containing protein 5-like [Huso huso]|uniref:THAP domain-containing protein 5 n=1 Tax=Huso huso TaxID=61971 RepID=A0ABR0ZD82_HUSHU